MSEEPIPLPDRWEVELEFVQSLANPQYVNFLAQNKYLEKQEFLNYLEYLEYWRKPEYAQYIVYPNCLYVLKLLKQPAFRHEILKADVAKMLMDEFYETWAGDASQVQKQEDDQQPHNGQAIKQEEKEQEEQKIKQEV